MKNWKKYAFASASLVALAASLAACGNLKGNNQKAADSASGDKPVIKMYQIGDKPDNLDELLENANKIIEEKVGAKLDIQYLGWGFSELGTGVAGKEKGKGYDKDCCWNADFLGKEKDGQHRRKRTEDKGNKARHSRMPWIGKLFKL